MKKELFVFLFHDFFTLINLGVQVLGAKARYTFVDFGLSQPLKVAGSQYL